MKLAIAGAEMAAPDVALFTFRHPNRPLLPRFRGGAHVDVHLPTGLARQYSLCSDPGNLSTYRIAVKLQPGSGGSYWLHENMGAVDHLPVSAPRSNFCLDANAEEHVFLAAGIGVTPFISMGHELSRLGRPFRLVHCRRPAMAGLFADDLAAWDQAGAAHQVTIADQRASLDLEGIFRSAPAQTAFYCCGPAGFMDAVRAAAAGAGGRTVAFELFEAPLDTDFVPKGFDAVLRSTGQRIFVSENETLLSALRRVGVQIPSSCGKGLCGSCVCKYSAGEVIHRDSILTATQRQSSLTACVSRCDGTLHLEC